MTLAVDRPVLFVRPEWYDLAACRGVGPHEFYLDRGDSTARALAICAGCPVRQQCAEFAVERNEPGIWGGLSHRERKALRRRRYWAAS